MPIKNHRTKIAATQTAAQVQALLARRGVLATQIEYSPRGEPAALQFVIELRQRRWAYRLPVRTEGVKAVLKREHVQPHMWSDERSSAVAWRIAKDWLEAQFALIDAGGSEIGEVFLPYLLVEQHTTLSQRFFDRPESFLLLPPAQVDIDGEEIQG
jgi:hypothetical protein